MDFANCAGVGGGISNFFKYAISHSKGTGAKSFLSELGEAACFVGVAVEDVDEAHR